jgi:hypothetical protein
MTAGDGMGETWRMVKTSVLGGLLRFAELSSLDTGRVQIGLYQAEFIR